MLSSGRSEEELVSVCKGSLRDVFDHLSKGHQLQTKARSRLGRQVMLTIFSTIEVVQDEELDPTRAMSVASNIRTSFQGSQSQDTEELGHHHVHPMVGMHAGRGSGLELELSCLVVRGVIGKFGFKCVGGVVVGSPGCLVELGAPLAEEKVDVDNVSVDGLNDLAVNVLSISIGVSKGREAVVVYLVKLHSFLS